MLASVLQQEVDGTVPTDADEDASRQPASFVIMHSVSKRHNIGTIARCATAFGVKEVSLKTAAVKHAVIC